MELDHARRSEKPDAWAPDGSEIRLLVANSAGSMGEVRLPPYSIDSSSLRIKSQDGLLARPSRPIGSKLAGG
jgi:hypothetical protein